MGGDHSETHSNIIEYLVWKLEIEAGGTCPPPTISPVPVELRRCFTYDVIENAIAAVDQSMKETGSDVDVLEARAFAVEKSLLLRAIEKSRNFNLKRAMEGSEYVDGGDFFEVLTGLVINKNGSVALLFKPGHWKKKDVIKLSGDRVPHIVFKYPKNTPTVSIHGYLSQFFKTISKAPEEVRVALTEAYLKAIEKYEERYPARTIELLRQVSSTVDDDRTRNQQTGFCQAMLSMLKGENYESGVAAVTEPQRLISLYEHQHSSTGKQKRKQMGTLHQLEISQTIFMNMLKGTFTERFLQWKKVAQMIAEKLILDEKFNVERLVAYYRGVRQNIINYRSNRVDANQAHAAVPSILKLWEAMEEQIIKAHLLRAQRIRLIYEAVTDEGNQVDGDGHGLNLASVFHFIFRVKRPPSDVTLLQKRKR